MNSLNPLYLTQTLFIDQHSLAFCWLTAFHRHPATQPLFLTSLPDVWSYCWQWDSSDYLSILSLFLSTDWQPFILVLQLNSLSWINSLLPLYFTKNLSFDQHSLSYCWLTAFQRFPSNQPLSYDKLAWSYCRHLTVLTRQHLFILSLLLNLPPLTSLPNLTAVKQSSTLFSLYP